jgi:ornithine carbamoyltransferase
MSRDIPKSLSGIKHFLSIHSLEIQALADLVDFCIKRKAQFQRGELEPMLKGKVLAMIFQKSSLRTRLGFEAAMVQLGGHAINLEDHQVGIAKREDPKDIARVISSMCDGIMARVFAHQLVVELAASSKVPVINGLSDWSHPCQALADMMTLKEHFTELKGRKVAYIGDGNNVARSLLHACTSFGMHFAIAAPEGYQLDDGMAESARSHAKSSEVEILFTEKPAEAADEADVVYTDVWTSMGQEEERQAREKVFSDYQINTTLLSQAKPNAVVMHCLPAYRNLEITDDVIDGPQSLIFPQAENRLHSQRALLEILLGQAR